MMQPPPKHYTEAQCKKWEEDYDKELWIYKTKEEILQSNKQAILKQCKRLGFDVFIEKYGNGLSIWLQSEEEAEKFIRLKEKYFETK